MIVKIFPYIWNRSSSESNIEEMIFSWYCYQDDSGMSSISVGIFLNRRYFVTVEYAIASWPRNSISSLWIALEIILSSREISKLIFDQFYLKRTFKTELYFFRFYFPLNLNNSHYSNWNGMIIFYWYASHFECFLNLLN